MGRWWRKETTVADEEEMTTLVQDFGSSLVIAQDGRSHRYGITDTGRLYISVERQGVRLKRVSMELQLDTLLTLSNWLQREVNRVHTVV